MIGKVEMNKGITKIGSNIKDVFYKFSMNDKMTAAVFGKGPHFTDKKSKNVNDSVTGKGEITVNQNWPVITNVVTSFRTVNLGRKGLSELVEMRLTNVIIPFYMRNITLTANENFKIKKVYRHIAAPRSRKDTHVLGEYYSSLGIRQYVV